ncbi:MAG: sigma-54-dependent Fis family transcriptional regulator [Fibrobacteria bacterium]|nr:sigma-54-dependent Fis family transcriptional regulator [Fibrobacteria bacterium]
MKILILDINDELEGQVLQNWSVRNTEIVHSRGGSEAIKLISTGGFGTAFISVELLNIDNLDTLDLVKTHNPGVETFIISDRVDTSRAEEAVRGGAHSILVRPVRLDLMETLVRKVIARAFTLKNHRVLEEHVMRDLLGSSPAMEKILATIIKVAPTNSSILIEGETGTGKEFIANLIHRLSNRVDEPFVTVNCAAIPENLMESELFGSKKGAYTGSIADRKGLFEEADNGTLFLDEIGELPLALQVKLLRFLQQKEVRKVGSTENRIVNVRVIAATNMRLKEALADGRFREDLYYRLNIFQITLPPLRERKENLMNLVQFFVERYSKQNDVHIKGLTADVKLILLNYNYPGNIRELENIIEHAVVLCDGGYIAKEHLPENLVKESGAPELLSLPGSDDVSSYSSRIETLNHMEKMHITKALELLNNNQTDAARRLGISRSTLWRKIKEHDIKV